jgi:hypothetical protein
MILHCIIGAVVAAVNSLRTFFNGRHLEGFALTFEGHVHCFLLKSNSYRVLIAHERTMLRQEIFRRSAGASESSCSLLSSCACYTSSRLSMQRLQISLLAVMFQIQKCVRAENMRKREESLRSVNFEMRHWGFVLMIKLI